MEASKEYELCEGCDKLDVMQNMTYSEEGYWICKECTDAYANDLEVKYETVTGE